MTHLERAKELLLAKTTQGQKIIALRNIRYSSSWSDTAVIDAHTEFLFDDGTWTNLNDASYCDNNGIDGKYVDQAPYFTIELSGQKKDFSISTTAHTFSLPRGEYFNINGTPVNVNKMSEADILEHLILGTYHFEFYNWSRYEWRYT